ncbi:MAG: TIGR02147 family protein, partial [Chitinivibrionales bacterium]|nr:TIGR02147 family protein [Chitinivibrionales bacterium]
MKPNIFSYLDYRQFLNDIYAWLKKERGRFSYRAFARMADSSSPNFLQFIRERKLHLSEESLNSLSDALDFSSKEKRYFEYLVAFDHAKIHTEKDKFFRHIVSEREFGPFKHLQDTQYKYLTHWYMPVVRELVTCSVYPGNPEWIAEKIIPAISASKVRKGIKLLESLDLIRYDEKKREWIQTDTIIRTESEVLSVAVINYYKSILSLGRDAVERFNPSERDIRGVTIGISDETYMKLKKRMEIFWQEVMDMANEPQDIERVY